ncbi:ARM repeat superfamily protein isoform X2 [Wolffia australiana]
MRLFICLKNVFMLELRHIRRKGKRYKGILSKERLPNYLQLLKRLWVVFDTDDVKARALSLRLLGCWAPLTHDNADGQYIIISGLRSQNFLEVKASLFACGCLSLFSEDFVHAIVSILIDITRSMHIPSNLKSQAARTFGNIQCSSLLASKAYKICKRLVLEAPLDDGTRLESLFSLTKLAMKSVILISEQVEFLLTVMAEECSAVTKSVVLKCFRLLCFWKLCHVLAKENVLSRLMPIINDQNLSLVLQCEALKILHQIFRDHPESWLDLPDLQSLVICIKDAAQSSWISKRYLSLGLLTDIYCNDKRAEKGNCSKTGKLPEAGALDFLTTEICLLIGDDISSAVNKQDGDLIGNDFKEKCITLSTCVLRLVQMCPESGLSFLSRLRGTIEDKISQLKLKPGHLDPSLEAQESAQNFSEVIISCLRYFVVPSLNVLKHNNQTVPEMCTIVNLLLNVLQNFGYFGSDVLELESFHLILRYNNVDGMIISDNRWIGLERFGLQLARKMTSRKNYWILYKIGKYSCMDGAWFAATNAFKHLIPKAKSDSCRSWLKALMLLGGSESEIRLLLFPDLSTGLVNELCSDVDIERPIKDTEERKRIYECCSVLRQEESEKLSRAHKRICSSLEVLSALKTQIGGFWFQTWLLSLRKKGLETVIDLLHLLLKYGSISPSADEINFLSTNLLQISRRFNQISREYDFMIISFMEMDVQSSELISRLALYYSLLGYFSGFSLYFEDSGLFLLEDLSRRLCEVDGLDLRGQLPFSDWIRGFPSMSRSLNKSFGVCGSDQGTLSICRFATDSIHCLLKEAKHVKSKEEQLGYVYQNYLHSFIAVLLKWMSLPFNVPPYFFRLRDCAGAELFVIGEKTANPNELYTFVGNQLSLHLCIQLKNISSIRQGRIGELHCILAVDSSESASSWLEEIDKSMNMHEQLLMFMKQGTNAKFDSAAVTYVRMEANSLGQGFSSCLLDVSSFPEGFYRIIWHGCCMDDDDQLWTLPSLNYAIPFSVVKRPLDS